jgi:dihydrolipoamide dehydrogenase
MSEVIETQVLVVGGGPGGYVAAIRCGQLGLKTTIVEADRLGGTCLIRGCIPSKALIHVAGKYESMLAHVGKGKLGIKLDSAPQFDLGQAVDWKETVVDKLNGGVGALLKKAKVRAVHGKAVFADAKNCTVQTADGEVQISAQHVILATGSVVAGIPSIPYGEHVWSSTEALLQREVPKKLVVIGAGYIGMELGMAYARMGSEVVFVEALDRILTLFDRPLLKPVEQWLKQHKIAVHLNTKAQRLIEDGNGRALEVAAADGTLSTLPCDKVLVAVGRRPATQGWGLERMAVDMNGPFVRVDERCHTSMRNVWAIGDLVGEPMLAHKASAQGEMVAEIIAGQRRSFNPVAIAAVCFTEPELVGCGLSPDEAKAQGIEVVVGQFPFAANGRSLAMESGTDGGFVRVTARADNHVVVGIHAVGAHVSELSGEFALALEMGARLEDLSGTIHVHPTMTETLPEAALAALGHAIHA